MTGVVGVVAVVGVIAVVIVGVVGVVTVVGPVTVVVDTGGALGVALSTAQFVLAPTPLQCQCSHMKAFSCPGH